MLILTVSDSPHPTAPRLSSSEFRALLNEPEIFKLTEGEQQKSEHTCE